MNTANSFLMGNFTNYILHIVRSAIYSEQGTSYLGLEVTETRLLGRLFIKGFIKMVC